jgi:hypothetical protein
VLLQYDLCEFAFADLDGHTAYGGDLGVWVSNLLAVDSHGRLCAHSFCVAAGFDKLAGNEQLLD